MSRALVRTATRIRFRMLATVRSASLAWLRWRPVLAPILPF